MGLWVLSKVEVMKGRSVHSRGHVNVEAGFTRHGFVFEDIVEGALVVLRLAHASA